MAKKQKKMTPAQLRLSTLRVARTGFALVGVYMLTIIIMDAWNLMPKEVVYQRWVAAGLLLVANTAVWYFVRRKGSASYYTLLVMTLAIAQIVFAAINVYWERGIGSELGPILFVVPILTAGAIRKRTAMLTTTVLAAAAYSTAVVVYFYENYGEGYRVELWGKVFFFSGVFFVINWLAMILAGLRHDSE